MRHLRFLLIALLLVVPFAGVLAQDETPVCEAVTVEGNTEATEIALEDVVIAPTVDENGDPVLDDEGNPTYSATYTQTTETTITDYGYIYAAGRVYIRETTNTDDMPEGLLEIGTTVQICGETTDENGDTWSYVQVVDEENADLIPDSDAEGWVFGSFLEIVEITVTDEDTVTIDVTEFVDENGDLLVDEPVEEGEEPAEGEEPVEPVDYESLLLEALLEAYNEAVAVEDEVEIDIPALAVEAVAEEDPVNPELVNAAPNEGQFEEGATNDFDCQGMGNSCNTAAAENSNNQGYVGDVNKFGCVGRGNSCNAPGQNNDAGDVAEAEAPAEADSAPGNSGNAPGKNK